MTSKSDSKKGEQIGPWRRLSTRRVYENPWIQLHHDDVVTPGNTAGIYGHLHFKNTAVGIVALDTDDTIYLVKQYRYTLQAYAIEIPMGGCPIDEDPMNESKRELAEETGLQAAEWRFLQTLHTSNSVTDELGRVYLATGLTQGASQPEPSEDIEVIQIPFSLAVDWAMTGKITDAISVAAILFVHAERLATG